MNKNYRKEYEALNRTCILTDGILEGSNRMSLSRNKFQVGTYIDAGYKQSENLLLAYRASIGFSNANEKADINDRTLTGICILQPEQTKPEMVGQSISEPYR